MKKIQPSNMYLSPSRPHELRFLLLKVPHLRTTYVHISITLPGLMMNIQETRRSWHLELLICPAYSLTHTEVLNKMNACCCLRKLHNATKMVSKTGHPWHGLRRGLLGQGHTWARNKGLALHHRNAECA